MELNRKPNYQDVSWFLDLNNTDQLDLNPSYQRKSVWNVKEQIFFLDTILNNYPSPSIFLHKETNEDGNVVYHVIDGKQRLTTIIDYSKDLIQFPKDYVDNDIAGKFFSELNSDYKRRFWDYIIPVEDIKHTNKEIIKSIFDRLNRNNQKLNRQELRKAKYDGEFFTFVYNESEDDFWTSFLKFSKRDFSRMIDQQFISELILVLLKGDVQGFNQEDLDELYSKYDNTFEEKEKVIDEMRIIQTYIQNINNQKQVIKDYYFTRSNFYTIWASIYSSIKNLPDVQKLSEHLTELAQEIKKSENEIKSDLFRKYVENSKGATTDYNQRKNRRNVILEIISKI